MGYLQLNFDRTNNENLKIDLKLNYFKIKQKLLKGLGVSSLGVILLRLIRLEAIGLGLKDSRLRKL